MVKSKLIFHIINNCGALFLMFSKHFGSLFSLIFFISIAPTANAQTSVYNKGVELTVSKGEVVFTGAYVNRLDSLTQSQKGGIYNAGTVYFAGAINDLAGNGIFLSDTGSVVISGVGAQAINGNAEFVFNKLFINKSSGDFVLNQNIKVVDTLLLQSGSINLNSYTINLDSKGFLDGETNIKRVYGSSGVIKLNRIINQPDFTTDLGGIGLQIKSSGFYGMTTIERGHAPNANVADGSIQRYYRFTPSTSDNVDSIRVNYLDSEIVGLEDSFAVYSSLDNGTSWVNNGGTVQVASNYITSKNIMSFQTMLLTIAGKLCLSPPVVELGADSLYLCGSSDSKVIDAGNTGMTYLWSPSAGNATTQTITVNAADTYFVRVTNTKGCSGYDTVKVGTATVPVAGYTYNIVTCHGDSTYFTNTSQLESGLTYSWDFGMAGSSLQKHPIVKFSDAGDYGVKLVVSTDKGCKDSLTKNLSVFPLPQASYAAVDTCNGNALSLTDNSTIATGFSFNTSIAQTSWNFGDGTYHSWNAALNPASERNPSLKNFDAGSYAIRLIAISNAGCKDTVEHFFTISPTGPSNCISPVVLNLGKDTYVCGDNYNITLNAGNSGSKYEWGSSNGFTSTEQIVTVSDTGSYWVRVDKGAGVVGSDTIHISQSKDIVAGIYLASSIINAGDTVQFIQLSEPDPVNFQWNFGDGVFSTDENPTHIYYLPSDYTVTMIVDNGFCADTVNKIINVKELKKEPEEEFPNLFTEIKRLDFYPNPTNGQFTIKLELESVADVKFEITDLMGKVLYEKQVIADELEASDYVSQLEAGLYILKVRAGSESRMLRFFKI